MIKAEQIRTAIAAAMGALLAAATPTRGFVVALVVGFGFNLMCGMRADGVSVVRCRNFSWRKARESLFELLLYFTVIYAIYTVVYACGDRPEAVYAAKALTYIFDYAYICNGFKNLIIAYPKNVTYRVVYSLLRFELAKALPSYWGPIISRLNDEFDKTKK